MLRRLRFIIFCFAACTLGGMLVGNAPAATILKLSLGGDSPDDVDFDGTTLATIDDGDAGTTGEQNTAIEFQDFLSGFADILTPTASFTLDGLTVAGPAEVFMGVLVIQDFDGGTLDLYDPANILLLSGTLDTSTLTGPLSATATGAIFTTSFGSISGGSLAPLIDPDSLALSMSLTDINAGVGLSVTSTLLEPFSADVTLNMAAEPIPEPATVVLLLLGAALATIWAVWRKRL